MKRPEPSADETNHTLLHLGRFAHGAPGATGAAGEEAETELIRKAAAEAVAGNVKPVVVPAGAAPLSPDELLGAVAYCYVKGVFSSTDIEQMMLGDAEFRQALGGVVPDPDTLRRFRRLNRDAFQNALERFYAKLRRQQKFIRETFPGSESSAAPEANGRPRGLVSGENTAIFVKREASDCLDKATFIDGMSDF